MSLTTEDLNAVLSKAHLVYNASQISKAIESIADQLNQRLENAQPLVLCVMNGGLVFSGHLITRLNCFPEISYIHATRYENQTRGNILDWRAYPSQSLKGRTVLILDDILDEGITLKAIVDYCYENDAKEVVTAVLVRKKHDRCIEGFVSDYVGLEVDDKYVFGFGMDYRSQLRHLNGVYALSE